jgi:single-strand DNA-binding protein
MNSVNLIGRLVRDPEVRYTARTQMAVCRFTLAIDRPVKAGAEKQTEFPRVTCFGKQAENCERFLTKGRLCGVQGRLQTGSYTDKNGNKVYTTDVIADRVEFLEWGDRKTESERAAAAPLADDQTGVPEGFAAIEDDDCPF